MVDEAYIDFSEAASLIRVLDQHPNLLVMQTLSKAWGLASLRLGMAFASPELIRVLNQIKPPYNISGLTQETVLSALQNKGKVDEFIQLILEEREFLRKELEKLPYILRVHPRMPTFCLSSLSTQTRCTRIWSAKRLLFATDLPSCTVPVASELPLAPERNPSPYFKPWKKYVKPKSIHRFVSH